MSPVVRHLSGHVRARALAAQRIDEPLGPADSEWLDEHLAGCAACAAVADAYGADRRLFTPLRDAAFVPPRDLWARTAAAIEAERGVGARPVASRRRSWLPLASLAPLAGLAVVAVLVGSTLLTGSPVAPGTPGIAGSPPAPTAIALNPGQINIVTRDADGGLQVLSAGVDEVCPLAAEQCGAATPSFATAPLSGLAASGHMDAIISPHRDRIVVVQRNASGSDGVYVLAVRPPTGGGAATIPTSTPDAGATSSAAPTATGAATPAETQTPTRKPGATGSPPSASASVDVDPSPSGTPPGETASVAPTQSQRPSASPTVAASPSVTPESTPEATLTPAPAVEVTPAPDGAIEIASDVVVVGSVAEYDADGGRFAFTARPADGSAGPDVYVWNTADPRAVAVTEDHGSLFAGWDGKDLLVSRVVDGAPRTTALSARTGDVRTGTEQPAWLPAISPDGTQAVWWNGEVELADDDVTWRPAKGRLVIGSWPAGTGDVQVLSRRAPASWQVRWGTDGSTVAVWTADEDGESGTLNLYAIDEASGRVRLADPLLRDEPALAGFSLEAGRLVYATPESGGSRDVWVFAWEGSSTGKVQLPGETEITVIR